MSRVADERGFTIIEISLFLAVSSILLVTLAFGLQRMISQVRFSDSVNSLNAYIQNQYEQVRSGVNPRDVSTVQQSCAGATNSAPGTSNCLLIGKMIQFTDGSSDVMTSYIIATKSTDKTNDHEALMDSGLVAVTETGREKYEIQWGAQFNKGRVYRVAGNTNAQPGPMNAIAILRSPISSQTLIYQFYGDKDIANLSGADRTIYLAQKLAGAVPVQGGSSALNQSGFLYITGGGTLGGRNAGICIDPGSVSSAIHSINPGVEPRDNGTNDEQIQQACEQ